MTDPTWRGAAGEAPAVRASNHTPPGGIAGVSAAAGPPHAFGVEYVGFYPWRGYNVSLDEEGREIPGMVAV